MKSNEIEFLLANSGQVLNLINGVSITKEAVAVHSSTLKTVRGKLDKLKEQYTNQEYMKTLSPPESKVITDNAQNLFKTMQDLQKELEYLDLSKQPAFLTNAVNELTHAYLLIEWLSETIGKSGRTVLPHLSCIKPDVFDKGKYKNQIDTLYSELEATSFDFYTDHVEIADGPSYTMLVPISDHLITAACWLRKEKERLLTEALPEINVIKIPDEVFPEIPKAPETVTSKN